jgi:hypothetical protein
MMATDSKALQQSLLKTNGQKNKGVHEQIPSDPTIFRHQTPNENHRWSLSENITTGKRLIAVMSLVAKKER